MSGTWFGSCLISAITTNEIHKDAVCYFFNGQRSFFKNRYFLPKNDVRFSVIKKI
ncbi:MAG: hypothetical protein IJU14_00630 [Clostridia bacterium]|nr:hypothetical protein [Clostridia bacterium]